MNNNYKPPKELYLNNYECLATAILATAVKDYVKAVRKRKDASYEKGLRQDIENGKKTLKKLDAVRRQARGRGVSRSEMVKITNTIRKERHKLKKAFVALHAYNDLRAFILKNALFYVNVDGVRLLEMVDNAIEQGKPLARSKRSLVANDSIN